MKPKIIFIGSDEYSLIVLKSLARGKRFQIVGVITPPHAQEIKSFAKKQKVSLPDFTSMIYIIEALKTIRPDVGILASFGKIIPAEVLDLPKHGILNIHPSLLPKYRGPTPVPTAILNGEKETGATIIKMDEEIDHGPIVAQFKEEIKPGETADDLLKRLFFAGAEVLKTILPAYLEGQIELRQQDHSKATYTKKFTREGGKIDWKKPAEYNEKFIRAMYPWPGAWSEIQLPTPDSQLQTKRLKILKAHLVPTIRDRKAKPISDRRLVLDQVQLEGKKPVTWKQFKEGHPRAKFT